MSKKLLTLAAILAGIGLFAGGFFFSQVNAQSNQPGWMMGDGQSAPGMMGNSQFGPGMMGNDQANGMMGMMMNGGMMGGQYGSGMMGNYGAYPDVEPLSITEAETAVTNYLTTLNNDNLSLGEIMIFTNHAYAQIIDETSGTGAFEVLVDPVTQNVFPEPGPNMMWNTEYGMMSGGSFGMMGGMMNGQYGPGMMGNGQFGGMVEGNMMGNFDYAPDAETNITAGEAIASAQEYLDAYLPGKTADEHADTFPGYYTLHVLEDDEVVGMLSVNAYTGQVFLHHWHGDFIEMAGEAHD
ncbi:MAG: hypothetical protein CL608_07955 [Anaerolineaceae bacterium]|nr:hypothetical protein [Anaerolineaceae bacterium]